jgi:hypothetical protein
VSGDDVQVTLDLGAPAADDVPAAGEAAARSPGPELPFTWTEAHRHVCEVRYVQGLAADAREAYLQRVAEKRGAAACERLRRDALR